MSPSCLMKIWQPLHQQKIQLLHTALYLSRLPVTTSGSQGRGSSMPLSSLTNCNKHQHSLKLTASDRGTVFSHKLFPTCFPLLWFICQIHLQRWPEASAFLLLNLLPFTAQLFITSRASTALCDVWNSEKQQERDHPLPVVMPCSLVPAGQC